MSAPRSDTTLVWLKRDLRLADHAPLADAARQAAHHVAKLDATSPVHRVLVLFLIEPEWLASPDCDASHVEFTLACLADLRARGLPLQVRQGSAPAVFDELHRSHHLTQILSHEETGAGWTYARDRAVLGWCRQHGIAWTEHAQTGVVRRLTSRNGWAARWETTMNRPAAPTAPDDLAAMVDALRAHQPEAVPVQPLPTLAALGLVPHGKRLQRAGEAAGQRVLNDFLAGRAVGYRRALSSPLSAERGCSRLSPHLAHGTLSMRTVHQATEAVIAHTTNRTLAHDLRGFASRLRWHCHFMQKLEDEPAIEWRNFSRAVDGLRPGDVEGGGTPMSELDQQRFAAWCEGRTGFPMVDACMRSLRATGWLNFRMRAMLVSFAANHLWLHWREPGLFLARQFLDYEPGIHWSQMQMQSGTTGINTLRIYSPTKQALEHDPDGRFIRRWIPEFGSDAYPAPVVDERSAVAAAKEKLYGLRATPIAQAEADAIQQRHGSRLAGLPATTRPRAPAKRATPDPAQGTLFD